MVNDIGTTQAYLLEKVSLVGLFICLPCTSCLTPPVAIDAQEAVIHASRQHHEEARESLDVVRVYNPVIQRILGVESERPVIYLLDGELDGEAIGVFRDDEHTILIGTEALEQLRPVLVHELVHLDALTTRWKRLPEGLQEALADWLELELVELRGKIQAWIDPPDPELRREILTQSPEQSVDDGRGSHRRSAALWIVVKLGPGRMSDLVARAETEGVATVPAEWIEAALPGPLDQRVEFVSLMELLYRDSPGTLLRAEVGSLSSYWENPFPSGAVNVEVRALDLPTYEGPQELWPGMAVQMPAPR